MPIVVEPIIKLHRSCTSSNLFSLACPKNPKDKNEIAVGQSNGDISICNHQNGKIIHYFNAGREKMFVL